MELKTVELKEKELLVRLEGEPREHQIIYREEGEGRPLVFIHGLASSQRPWVIKIFPFLSGVGRLVAFDLPGLGRSEAIEQELTVSRCVETVKLLLEKLDISNPCIIGNSLGGTIALAFGGRYPELVDAVVAQGAVYKGSDFSHHNRIMIRLYKRFANTYSGETIGKLSLVSLPFGPIILYQLINHLMAFSDLRRIDRGFLATGFGDLLAFSMRAVIEILDDLTRIDLEEELREYRVPVLVIDGDEVSFRPVNTLHRIAKLIPQHLVRKRVVCGAGHLAPFVKPKEFAYEINDFIALITKLKKRLQD